jgi:hypothetical protein
VKRGAPYPFPVNIPNYLSIQVTGKKNFVKTFLTL